MAELPLNCKEAFQSQEAVSSALLSDSPSCRHTDRNAMGQIISDALGQRKFTFPNTIAEFGYAFNENEELRDIETGQRFVFVAKEGDKEYNQKRYEALGELMTLHVYDLLERECALQRVYLPVDAELEDPRTFVFRSADFFTNSDKLLLLIHGSGVVRAGQWARRLIINDSLNSGTQLPFIKRAVRKGYAVLVLNTNLNRVPGEDGKLRAIPGNRTPEDHAWYVWKHLVSWSPAKQVDIVAHSYGGVVTVELMRRCLDARRRVQHVAFTDSVHSLPTFRGVEDDLVTWFGEHAINWVTSRLPVDTDLAWYDRDVRRRSAGVEAHEQTSWSAFQAIFKFLALPLPLAGGVGDDRPSKAVVGAEEELPDGASAADQSSSGDSRSQSVVEDEERSVERPKS